MDPDYCIVVSVLYNFLHIKRIFLFPVRKVSFDFSILRSKYRISTDYSFFRLRESFQLFPDI
jgi:hypothetical protein